MKELISVLTKITAVSVLVGALVACGGADERKAKYLEKGKAFFAEKNYEKAAIEIKNVLQIDPKFSDAYLLLGEIEDYKKEYGKAISNYLKVIELDKDNVAARLKLARLYIIIGSTKFVLDAERYINEVMNLEPGNIEAQLYSAIINYKNNDTAENLAVVEKISSQDPSNIDGITMLVYSYISKDQDQRAIEVLEKGVVASPEDVSLRMLYARLLTRNDLFDKAEEQLKKAISLDEENYNLKVALTGFYSTLGSLDKAESVLRQAILEDPNDEKKYLVLIKFLSSKRSADIAEDELKKLIVEKPDTLAFKFYLAELYRGTGRVGPAKEILSGIVEVTDIDKDGIIARTMLADLMLDERDYTKPSEYIDAVLKEYPSNPDALILRSKLSLMLGDSINPVNDLRTVLKSHPKNEEASMLLAKAHVMNREPSLAEEVLSTAIANDSGNYKVYVNLASYYVQNEKVEKAIDVIEKALIRIDDNYELLLLQSKILAKLGDEPGYVKVLDKMKKAYPDDYKVFIEYGKYYLAKRDYVKAKQEFQQGQKLSKDNYKLQELMVRTYALSGNIDEAIPYLNNMLDKVNAMNNAGVNHLLGQVYMAKNNSELAEKHLNQSIADRSDWPTPYMSLADLYAAQAKYDDAISIYSKAISTIATNDNFRIKLAGIYEKKDDYESAITEYQKVLDGNSKNDVARNNLASLLLESRSDEASYKKALELVSDFENSAQPAFRDTLAWAYYHLNDNVNAVRILEEVISKVGNIAVFQYHYGMALLKNGNKEAAKKHLGIAVSSDQAFIGKDEASKLLKTL